MTKKKKILLATLIPGACAVAAGGVVATLAFVPWKITIGANEEKDVEGYGQANVLSTFKVYFDLSNASGVAYYKLQVYPSGSQTQLNKNNITLESVTNSNGEVLDSWSVSDNGDIATTNILQVLTYSSSGTTMPCITLKIKHTGKVKFVLSKII